MGLYTISYDKYHGKRYSDIAEYHEMMCSRRKCNQNYICFFIYFILFNLGNPSNVLALSFLYRIQDYDYHVHYLYL